MRINLQWKGIVATVCCAAFLAAGPLAAGAAAPQMEQNLNQTNSLQGVRDFFDQINLHFVTVEGKRYYLSWLGERQSFAPGFVTLDGRLYFVEQDGYTFARFEPGFVELDGKVYRVLADGYTFARHEPGFVILNGQRYLAGANGYQILSFEPGFVTIEGKLYHIEPDGITFTPVPEEFVTLDGRMCHGTGDGYTIQTYAPGFVTVEGRLYRIAGDGYTFEGRTAGFYSFDGELYCVPSDGAEFLCSGSQNGLWFDEQGRYTSGNAELDELVKQTLAQCTDESMSAEQKLRAAYLYVRDNGRYLAGSHQPRGSTDWTEESARFFFQNHRGNCYCFAGAFLYLARQLGFPAYPVSGGVGYNNSDHAWVMIPWWNGQEYIFDVELEYAYLYRYDNKRELNLYQMTQESAPFIYTFPQ